MAFTYAPFAKALHAATDGDEFANAFTYQDYLYEMLADGSAERAVTEQQWEMICDIIGKRRMVYASTVKHALSNITARQAGRSTVRHCDDCDFATTEADVTVCPDPGCRGSVG